jgi:hypothetical protein
LYELYAISSSTWMDAQNDKVLIPKFLS